MHPYLFLVVARLRESVKGGGGRAWLRAIEGVFGWAFQSAFTFAKANQRAQMLQLLLPKASFWSTTNQKHLYPPLSPAFGKKITQLCHYQKTVRSFSPIASLLILLTSPSPNRPRHRQHSSSPLPSPPPLLAAAASPPRPIAAAAASPAKLPARAKSSSFGRRWRAWEVLAADLPCGQRPWSSAAVARPSTRWTRRCSASA